MRVCLVSYEFPPFVGGEATYTFNLACGLAESGHDVTVITAERPGRTPPSRQGFRVVRVPHSDLPLLKVGTFMMGARRVLAGLCRASRVDLIHVAFDYPTFPVGLRGFGVPVVATVHHLHTAELVSEAKLSGNWARLLFPGTVQAALTLSERHLVSRGMVIAVSRFTKESLATFLGVEPGRVRVVYNGVEASSPPSAGGRPGSQPYRATPGKSVLFVGRLRASKGLDWLIRAFSATRDSVKDASLVIVGTGPQPYVASLKELAGSLGLGSSVVFTGEISSDDLGRVYASCGLVVLPSVMEGMGMSLLEGMAAGKACIGTRVGAIPEVIQEGVTGLTVDPGDVVALSKGMTYLLENPETAQAMGAKGRSRVLDVFSTRRMVQGTEAVYAEAVKAP